MYRAALVGLFAGCIAYDETVHVRVRDPAAVTVAVDTPAGERTLVGVGSGGADESPVPGTAPPYLENARDGASLERRGTDVVAVCTWCEWPRERTVIAGAGAIELAGTPRMVRRIGDRTRMTYRYVAMLPCHRHRGLCDRPAFELQLDTPHDNVAEIDFQRRVARDHGELTGAKIAVGWGLAFVASGLAMIGYYDLAGGTSASPAKWAAFGAGSSFAIVGGLFTWLGVGTLRARDTVTAVEPP
jgi:hypothetical protein